MSRVDLPDVPADRLEERGWSLTEERAETVFDGLGVSVSAHSCIYEDAALRKRVAEASGHDRIWRFFFGSRLDITPSPGFGMASVAKPHVVRESKKKFADDLRDRGFTDVVHRDTETVRLGDGTRARLTPYRAQITIEGETIHVVGALAVWHDSEFTIAGGAYPKQGLDRWADIDPDAYESELLELIRAAG
jgi:hypothetical protein